MSQKLDQWKKIIKCDACKACGEDRRHANGPRHREVHSASLYRVYQSRKITLKLCYLHSLELFQNGERIFLERHIPLARYIVKFRPRYKDLEL